jgi:hypothetical protein
VKQLPRGTELLEEVKCLSCGLACALQCVEIKVTNHSICQTNVTRLSHKHRQADYCTSVRDVCVSQSRAGCGLYTCPGCLTITGRLTTVHLSEVCLTITGMLRTVHLSGICLTITGRLTTVHLSGMYVSHNHRQAADCTSVRDMSHNHGQADYCTPVRDMSHNHGQADYCTPVRDVCVSHSQTG